MSITIELTRELEAAVALHAQAEGVDAGRYMHRVLERALGIESEPSGQPFKTGRGMLAKYGTVPTAEEIDANSADMFSGFGESTP